MNECYLNYKGKQYFFESILKQEHINKNFTRIRAFLNSIDFKSINEIKMSKKVMIFTLTLPDGLISEYSLDIEKC